MARLTEALEETLRALTLTTADAAAIQLARGYARVLDEASADEAGYLYERLGPKLHSVLDSLGATPKARGARGGVSNDVDDELAALRNRAGRV